MAASAKVGRLMQQVLMAGEHQVVRTYCQPLEHDEADFYLWSLEPAANDDSFFSGD